MADPFIGEIDLFPYNFAPENYLHCNGQTLNVSQYQALYSLISNIYGGNDPNTFMLPNLIGTTAVGVGQASPNGVTWQIGQPNGSEAVTLNLNQYPGHNHTLFQPSGAGTTANVATPQAGAAMTGAKPTEFFGAPASTANTTLHPSTLAPYPGGGTNVAAHENRQPYLVLMPCIATSGVYPIFD
jgi:microcystin-dependent protein